MTGPLGRQRGWIEPHAPIGSAGAFSRRDSQSVWCGELLRSGTRGYLAGPSHPHPGRARCARFAPPTRPSFFFLVGAWGPHAHRIGSRNRESEGGSGSSSRREPREPDCPRWPRWGCGGRSPPSPRGRGGRRKPRGRCRPGGGVGAKPPHERKIRGWVGGPERRAAHARPGWGRGGRSPPQGAFASAAGELRLAALREGADALAGVLGQE